MSSAIDGLKREHRAIEAAIGSLGEVCNRMEAGEVISPDDLSRYIDFIRRFADGCHHEKEEQVLFPALVDRGFPRDVGPVGCMLNEHEQGRAFVRAMSTAVEELRSGNAWAAKDFFTAARGYSQLLTEHIYKEDNVLFRMAETMIGEDGLNALEEDLRAAERRLGSDYEQYQDWAHGVAVVKS